VSARVDRDTRGTGVGIVLLTLLGGIGIIFALRVAGPALLGGDPSYFVVLLLVLLVLAGVSTLIVLVRGKGKLGADGVRRIFVGTIALAGSLVVLSALLLLAGVVYVLAVCYSGGMRSF
jgi:hypothetical protein